MTGARNLIKGINCDANAFVAKVAEERFACSLGIGRLISIRPPTKTLDPKRVWRVFLDPTAPSAAKIL